MLIFVIGEKKIVKGAYLRRFDVPLQYRSSDPRDSMKAPPISKSYYSYVF